MIITSASGIPEESGPETVTLFHDHGAKQVMWLHIADTTMANSDSVVALLKSAKGIFFSGGVQARLLNRVANTKSEKVIKELYYKHAGIIGGTSAGAAVMSEFTITGDGDFTVLNNQNIVTMMGFGFLSNCIIDQHFVARQRNNRLLSLVIEKNIIGVGIDESTAILYSPNDTFEVFGTGSVVIYDPENSKSFEGDSTNKLSATGIILHVLKSGQKFNMRTGRLLD